MMMLPSFQRKKDPLCLRGVHTIENGKERTPIRSRTQRHASLKSTLKS